ncbi:MAG: histidinol-phosphate transaminase [Gammaproteobacteria bacterium]|nr:histidinol-phosphate transaminase [Gammaproteobacteria bacterium]
MTNPIDKRLAALIRPEIRALKAYHVADARGLIKLDAMENPYGWPEELRAGWQDVLRAVEVNRYPDPGAVALTARLRDALAVPAPATLLLGNGSDELIQIILLALARPGAVVLAPTPTFVMYQMTATFVGMKFIGVPLPQNFALDRAAMLAAITQHQPAVIFLSYPNNPTGNLFDAADIDAILNAAPGLVIVDEAYHAFAEASFMDRLGKYDNLLVMRTLSKQGLAGLRLGVLAGDPKWIAELDKVRLPYNINALTQASAEFALTHRAAFDQQCAQIRAERALLQQALERLPGVDVWPSRANFLLFRPRTRPAGEIHAGLRQAGILIKNLDPSGGALAGCLRVTVGSPTENRAFVTALTGLL